MSFSSLENLALNQLLKEVELLDLLGDDLYTTYLANYQEKRCVVKFFTAKSDRNNEYAVLELLQSQSKHPEWYPKPYRRMELDHEATLVLNCLDVNRMLEGVYEIIVYEYLEGSELGPDAIGTCLELAAENVSQQLNDLHLLGLVFADVRRGNVIYGEELQRYLLIDYGRVFHATNPSLPPMAYMIEYEDELPTQEDDWDCLTRALKPSS